MKKVYEYLFYFFLGIFAVCFVALPMIACATEDRSHTQAVWFGYTAFVGVMSFMCAGIVQSIARITSGKYYYD